MSKFVVTLTGYQIPKNLGSVIYLGWKSALFNYAEPYIPYRDGYLNDSFIKSSTTPDPIVESDLEYAREVYQATNRRFNKDKHSLATAEFFNVAQDNHEAQIIFSIDKLLQKEFK